MLVTKVEEIKKEGEFETVAVQDAFVYKGKIEQVGIDMRDMIAVSAHATYVPPPMFNVGDVILFAKYSPDTHEIEHEGVKYKFISFEDILAIV